MDQWCNVDPRPRASSSLTLLVTAFITISYALFHC
ncbi:hypothetical protein OESDEN_16839 [Oesophagostomum dentatum]|uniref:Uncharacterized protein n=1 Tax=Oesophagostomum dentatum TaxID=61180 RepID=A0A0B1SDR5_OESDE|nr:hypothetical protein OESDEN_16839 [Oesophagostomum dentatum]